MTSWLFCFECENIVKVVDMENLAFENFIAKDGSPPTCKKHPKATHRLRDLSDVSRFPLNTTFEDFKEYNLEKIA